jgi:recombination protein RecA
MPTPPKKPGAAKAQPPKKASAPKAPIKKGSDEPREVKTPAGVGAVIDSLVDGMKSHGDVKTLDDDGLSIVIPGVIPSGDHWLDYGLGRGGWPFTRISLLGGDEGTGKTTAALMACAMVQRMGGVPFYVDAEYKLDRDYAKSKGVDMSRLILSQPGCAEDAWDTIRAFTAKVKEHRSEGRVYPVLIVADSLSAFVPRAELEGDMGDQTIGLQARIFGKALRIMAQEISHEMVHLMMITQLRQKIGVQHGDDDVTAGGKAPRFYSTIIVKMEPGATLKAGDVRTGNAVRVTVSKNQVAPPFRKVILNHYYTGGWDTAFGMYEMLKASEMGTISGSWLTVDECGIKFQGVNGLGSLDDEDREKLIRAIRKRYGWNDAKLYL